MSCQHKLCWYELIPLLSFFALRGRCLRCKTRISRTYPLVECITGLVFAGLFLKFQDLFFIHTPVFFASYAYYALMFSLLIVVAFYDLKHKIIPDVLSFIFGLLAFLGLFVFTQYVYFPHVPTLIELLSGVCIAAPLALFWLLSGGRWMGLGDAKLALGLGWLLGLAVSLSAVVLAFWIGAIVGLLCIVFKRGYGMKTELPFAFYLFIGAFFAFIFELNIFAIQL